jgi:hypothetical protein
LAIALGVEIRSSLAPNTIHQLAHRRRVEAHPQCRDIQGVENDDALSEVVNLIGKMPRDVIDIVVDEKGIATDL